MDDHNRILGRILVEAALLDPEKANAAVQDCDETGVVLDRFLIDRGLLQEKEIVEAMGTYYGQPAFYFSREQADPGALDLLTEEQARRYGVVPVSLVDDSLIVATCDPHNVYIFDSLRQLTGRQIQTVVAGRLELQRALAQLYAPQELDGADSVSDGTMESYLASTHSVDIVQDDFEEMDLAKERKMSEVAPIVNLANQILLEAVRRGASDIHLEPKQRHLRIRLRILGVLQEYRRLPKWTQGALTSRFKLITGLDIAQRRLPQDGRLSLRVDGREVDLRVSTLPVRHGEKVVMRVLDKARNTITLESLGMDERELEQFRSLTQSQNGIILITGPTGSGKSTTLYAALRQIENPSLNIMTLEDPIEYDLEELSQSQVLEVIGMTFAEQLRALLRQDPDVIMVGEMRDRESAEVAVRAALTGHLVLSTLHTNDAPSAATRLIDMGIEPYLVASTLVGVVAQRLIRVLCSACKAPVELSADDLRRLGLHAEEISWQAYRAVGCAACHQTGYSNRQGVFEILRATPEVRDAINLRKQARELAHAAGADFRSMRQAALAKLAAGTTSYDEVLRVIALEMHAGEVV